LVGYLGFSKDRVKIRQGDALTLDLPQAVLGLSETFGAAFIREPGMEIIHRLAQRTRLVVPAIGKLFVRDFPTNWPETGNEPWQEGPSVFDLTQRHEYVGGLLTTSEDGPRFINVYSGLYRADGTPIIDDPSIDDDIMQPITIGATPDAPRGSVFAFRYPPGRLIGGSNPVEIHQVIRTRSRT
jgi:hypothetical protein